MYRANRTLDKALKRAFRKQNVGMWRRIKIRKALRDPDKHEEIAYVMTEMAMEASAIPPEGAVDDTGIYVGAWTDLFSWIIENWDSILAMIMSIIDLFSDEAEEV